jgi:hypothetical protein
VELPEVADRAVAREVAGRQHPKCQVKPLVRAVAWLVNLTPALMLARPAPAETGARSLGGRARREQDARGQ